MTNHFEPGSRRLKPSAAPVNTYVQPRRAILPQLPTNQSGLAQLGEALQTLNPSIQKFLADTKTRQDAADNEFGANQYDQLRKSYAQAVADGDIPAGASPFVRKGYQEKAGQWDATSSYHLSLVNGWKTSGLATKTFGSEDEAADAFQHYMTGAKKSFIQEHLAANDGQLDVDWMRGFQARAGSVEQQLIQQHVAARVQTNDKNLEREGRREIGNILYGEAEDVAAKIASLRDGDPEANIGGYAALGITDDKFNAWVLSEVQTSAETLAYAGHFQQARELIGNVDALEDRKGVPLSQTTEGRKVRVELEDKLTRIQTNAESLEHSRLTRSWAIADRALQRMMLENSVNNLPYIQAQRERAEKDRNDGEARELKFAESLSTVLADPGKDHEPLLAELAATPNYAPLVSPLRTAWSQRVSAQNKVDMTPDLIASAGQLEVDLILGEATVQDVLERIRDKKIDASTMGRLISVWGDKYRYDVQKQNAAFRVKEVSDQGEVFLLRILSKRDAMGQETNGTLVVQALMSYQDDMSEFLENNPSASVSDVRRKRNEIVKSLADDPVYKATMSLGGRPPLKLPSREF